MKLLFVGTLTIQKFPGKGGWHFVEIPLMLEKSESKFGWIKVCGEVNGYEIKQYKLAPKGKGKHFLPLKAELRKKIQKGEGDQVKLVLYKDESALEVPAEILECLEAFPEALDFFQSMSESNQKYYIDWVIEAKNIDTKVSRINQMIDRLLLKKGMYDQ